VHADENGRVGREVGRGVDEHFGEGGDFGAAVKVVYLLKLRGGECCAEEREGEEEFHFGKGLGLRLEEVERVCMSE